MRRESARDEESEERIQCVIGYFISDIHVPPCADPVIMSGICVGSDVAAHQTAPRNLDPKSSTKWKFNVSCSIAYNAQGGGCGGWRSPDNVLWQ